jgi:hypothetical protein
MMKTDLLNGVLDNTSTPTEAHPRNLMTQMAKLFVGDFDE